APRPRGRENSRPARARARARGRRSPRRPRGAAAPRPESPRRLRRARRRPESGDPYPARCNYHPCVNLLHLFDLSLVNRRDAPALEWGGETFTFGDIDRRSNRVANALRARGFLKGDRLCVYLANRIELVDIFLACVKLGVIFVPINILYREREIAHITGDAEPRATITEADLPLTS